MKSLNIGSPEWNIAFSYWATYFTGHERGNIRASIYAPFYDPRFLDRSPHALVEACRETSKLRVFWGRAIFLWFFVICRQK